jgi:hypothetical protein
MDTPQVSNDEARLDLLWYMADAYWFFVGSEDEPQDQAEESLEAAQAIALAIAESMDMKVEKVLGDREFLVRVKLAEDPHEAIKSFLGL